MVGSWSQTISPFHPLLRVCASEWHIYFVQIYTSNPVYSHIYGHFWCFLPHTHTWGVSKGEFEFIDFLDTFYLLYIHTGISKNVNAFIGISQEFLGFCHFCVSQHMWGHYNKKDFLFLFFLKGEISRDCGDSSQSLPCIGFWWRDGLLDVLTENQMILSCVSGLFESWILSRGIVSAVIANFLLERFMIK